MLPYYVEPEYWDEGYAEGDAKLVSGSTSVALSISAAPNRIKSTASVVAAETSAASSANVIFIAQSNLAATSQANASAVRVVDVSSTGEYYVEQGYWQDGYESAAIGQLNLFASTSLLVKSSAEINAAASFSAAIARIKTSSASAAINAIFTASARLKWEPEPDTPETWSDVPSASGIWTDVPDTSEIWTEVA